MPPMHRTRFVALALTGVALAAACGDTGPGGSPHVVIAPILDSLFIGDTLPARTARYFDANGDSQATGPVGWSSSDGSVFTVDNVSGAIVGVGPGAAVLSARANGVTGSALLVVSRALDLSLLLDTIYLMPGDTLTIPVAVRDKDGSPPPVWFTPVTSAVITIDSATGRITASGESQLISFTAHADSVSATGAVQVVQLTDTTGGKGSFTVLGTVIRRTRAGARAVNYRRQGDTATFRVSLPVAGAGGVTVENTVITLRDSVRVPRAAAIDSISFNEAFGPGSDFVCRPKRPWALWSIQTAPPLSGLSRPGGAITITQVVAVTNGLAVSGRFSFTGQRSDLYNDPLAALPVRGTFVAPLIADNSRRCG
jgi:hypothetical protein